MTSTFTWLDYSEHDRRKMVDVISAFQERDTRDELGIGAIRDGFADLFFPGTSTIQTRARYFLFIPWNYLALERLRTPSAVVTMKARKRETSLINALEREGHHYGNIGREARDRLKRLPSNIYWQGLRTLGILRFPGSQDQYHRSLDRFYQTSGRMLKSDDADLVVGLAEPNWHVGIPPPPEGFPWKASFDLRPEDAEYLKGRILSHVGASLLAHLVRQPSPPAETDSVWESEGYGGFPAEIRTGVDHARCFSETIHGAALLYNLMLAELARREADVETYRSAMDDWANRIEQRRVTLAEWDLDAFWEILDRAEARITTPTRRFVMKWLGRLFALPEARAVADDRTLRDLIHDRERRLKGGQARLDNPRALEAWSGAAGTGRLDFRWAGARTIVTDILEGFGHA